MTNWPTAPVSTALVDDGNDNPRLARADIDDAFDKLNQIIEGPAIYETRAGLNSATVPTNVPAVRTTGYTTKGDGGPALYIRAGAEPSHAFKTSSNGGSVWWEGVVERALSARQMGATGDGVTDDATALANWLTSDDIGRNLFLPQGVYLIGTALVATDNPHKLVGAGWQKDGGEALIGTVLKASSTAVADLLTFQSTSPASLGTTETEGLVVQDMALLHRGAGAALLIDNVIHTRFQKLYIDCNNEGAIGVKLDHWAFFTRLDQLSIHKWTNTGVQVFGAGSQHHLVDCHISSAEAGANYGVDVRDEGVIIEGGQITLSRADNLGIAVRFFSEDANPKSRGVVRDLLVEAGIGVSINDGSPSATWNNIEVDGIRADLGLNSGNVGPVVVFGDTENSVMLHPQIDRPTSGGTLAEWKAASVNCGVICNLQAAQAPVIVAGGATHAYKKVEGRISYADRGTITTDANLHVICENVQEIGRTVHNGTSWDKFRASLADDAATSFTPPRAGGVVKVTAVSGKNIYGIATYGTFGATPMQSVAVSSLVEINTTDGTLTGTTGTDGVVTLRTDTANDLVYVENRTGATNTILIEFCDGFI